MCPVGVLGPKENFSITTRVESGVGVGVGGNLEKRTLEPIRKPEL